MKNILLLFFFCIGSGATAQQESNPFSSAERNNPSHQNEATTYERGASPGNPDPEDDAPPTPIDDYIPLLVLTAVGIIIYQTQKKRNLLS